MKKIDYRKNFKIVKNIDWKLVAIVLVIFLIGILILSSATHANITKNYTQIYKQLLAFVLGVGIIMVMMLFDYDSVGKYYKELYVFSIIMLLIVWIPGLGDRQFGAISWIRIGKFNLQTSEIVKMTFILSYAKIVEKHKDSMNNLRVLFKLVVYAMPIIGLLLAQPDLGTAIVFVCIIFFMLYVVGLDKKIIRNTLISILLLTPLMYMFMAPHQRVRIVNFFNPELSSNYQVLQSMIAIGSGGIFGVLGEEFGLIGMLVVIILFMLLITRLLMIAKKSKNVYGTLIVSGITGMFVYQIIQNIGMTVGLMPVTGVTLPFVSYGGSSILTSMANIGIVLNVYLRRRRIY